MEYKIEWTFFNQDLKVFSIDNELLFSTVTGFVSPKLTEEEVRGIESLYTKNKMNYVFV